MFPKEKRPLIGDVIESKKNAPGPGTYNLPSDFGYSYQKKYLDRLIKKMRQ